MFLREPFTFAVLTRGALILRSKLQRQLDGAAAIATENSIALLSALGKGQLAKALRAAEEEEATG